MRTGPSAPGLGLAARLAWRETRAGWRHFTGLVACVALGVAALAGVDSFADGLHRTMGREARVLLGGDLELRSARPLPDEAEAAVAGLAGEGATVTRIRELAAMARNPATGRTLLVELKAVDGAYPLYGRLETERPPSHAGSAMLGDGEVLVQAPLLARLGLSVGGTLEVGGASFTVAGLVTREPDRPAGMFALGPRVLLSDGAMARTDLIRQGSRVRHRLLVRLPAGRDAVEARAGLSRTLTDPAIRVATHDDAQPGLRRFLDQLTTYLGLVGLTSLLVGGIGVAASVRTFVRRKLTTIAILKTLGASSATLVLAYALQALALGGLGSVLGLGLATAVRRLLDPVLAAFIPFTLEPGAAAGPMARGLLMGLLVTLLSALWPLLEVRAVAPALLLRHPVEPPGRAARRPWGVGLLIAAGLAALVLWQARSAAIGGIFAGAAAAALGLLALGARAGPSLARRLPRLRWLAWRQGLAGLNRPGGEARGVVVALGVGVMLLSAVALLERALGAQLDLERRREAPSFFFVDVQPDQQEAFRKVLDGVAPGVQPTMTPVVRARLAAIEGAPVTRARWEGRDEAWRFTREYVLTYTADLPAGNQVTRGQWWGPGPGGSPPRFSPPRISPPRISVEDETARALGVSVGGRLTFDVQGVPIEAEVTSLRKVDWQTLSTNFFVIFAPGALEGAPLSYVATARVPAALETAVQDQVTAAFPNVTAIPVRDILDRVTSVLDRIALAVRLVAGFVILAGLVVMLGALATSRAQRLYESVLLKTLGATRGLVARAFAVEYGCLGLLAGLGGTGLGALLAWVVLRLVLDVPFRLDPAALCLSVGLSVLLALAVGALGTFRLLGQPPLAVLRRE